MSIAFERPVFNSLYQSFANRIFLNVNPFLRAVLARAQAMMPAARLKTPVASSMPLFEISFPKSNPLFNGESQVMWRAKYMNVVRHQQIISGQPSGCSLPCFLKKLLRGFVCQPRNTVFGGDGQQNDVVAVEFNMDASGRIFPANFIHSVVAIQFHAFI